MSKTTTLHVITLFVNFCSQQGEKILLYLSELERGPLSSALA